MSERLVPHVMEAMAGTCWAVTPERLSLMCAIAAREAGAIEGGDTLEAIAAKVGRPLDNSRTVTVRDGVAVIPIESTIFPRASLFTAISGGVSVDTVAADFSAALADPSVTGIVLLIDSPGGDKNGVPELASMIYGARGQKPIVAYGREYVASAAYWIAAAADRVIIAADALVGSIGVIGIVPDPGKRGGGGVTFVSSQSPHKRTDPTTETGRARIQDRIDTIAELFITDVARYRGVSPERVAADFGQGDVLVGQAAVDAGLADELGSLEGVIATLQQGAREPRQLVRSAGRMAAQDTGGTVPDQKGRMDRFVAWLSGEGDDSAFAAANIAASGPRADLAGEPLAPPASSANSQDNEELTRLRAELARRDQAERARAEADIAPRAAAFAAAEITAGRALPANRDTLVAAYTDAATDDLAHPRAEGQPSRVARLEAIQASHVPHALTGEAVPVKAGDDGTLHLLANTAQTKQEGAPAPATVEGWREQRAFTATGRTILTALGIPATGPLSDAHRATIATRMREQGLTIAE